MLPLAFTILLETRFATLDAGIAMAAQSSARPRECRGAVSGGSDGLWLRLRGSDAERYCDLLARGHARLRQTPNEALSAARAAETLAGSTPAVRVLAGRAQLRLAQPALAYELFAQAEGAEAQAFADPKALHDYARAASLAQQPGQAVRLYRLLISRAALLDDALERAFALVEAAGHVLAHVPNGADEALGYLGLARAQPLGLTAWVSGLRLLALQRSGRAEARAPNSWPSVASLGAAPPATPSDEVPLLPPGQWDALRALLGAAPEVGPVTGKPR